MSINYAAACELLPRILCCEYLLAVLVEVSANWLEGERARNALLRWGVGVQANGQCEFLGVWHGAAPGAREWTAIFEDLKVRGVEGIRFVVGSDPVAIGAAMRVSYPAVVVLPAIGHFPCLAEPNLLDTLPPRQHRTVSQSVEAANQLNQRLLRALARRGRFPDAAVAASFAIDWLARAERDFEVLAADDMACHSQLAARSIGRTGTAAAGV